MKLSHLNRNQKNAVMVIRQLALEGSSTQIHSAQALDLHRTSVFKIYENMLKAKLLEVNSSVTIMGKGRPRHLWQLNKELGVFVTIYSNPGQHTIQLTDFNGQQFDCLTSVAADTFEEELQAIVKLLTELASRHRICGLIFLLPGWINHCDGTIFLSKSWNISNFPLKQELTERLRQTIPDALILIDNNCRVMAWGQRCGGACTGLNNFMALLIREGRRNGKRTPISVGSGMVAAGQIYRGRSGGAGELDHSCYQWWSKIYTGDQYPVSLMEIDRTTREYFATSLGKNFSQLVNYLEPERIVVVFEQTPVEDFFLALRHSIHQNLLHIKAEHLPIELSGDGIGSIIRGGLSILREQYFSDDERIKLLCRNI